MFSYEYCQFLSTAFFIEQLCLVAVSYVFDECLIEELHNGAKRPQCNSHFRNKIEVQYNIG